MSEPEKPEGDQARYSLALLGFYASCAAVAGGAAMFFFASFVLTKEAYGVLPMAMKVAGAVFIAVGAPGAFLCLARARRPVSVPDASEGAVPAVRDPSKTGPRD